MSKEIIEGESVAVQRRSEPKPIQTVPMDHQIASNPTDQTERGLKLFEEAVRVAREKLRLALTLTEPGQLIVMAGDAGKETVYFTSGAADRILRMGFGMRWGDKTVEVIDQPDGSKLAIARAALIRSNGEEHERFEGRRKMRIDPETKKIKGYIRSEEDLIKSALANMKHIAVTDVLGMRELTPSDLIKLGIDVSKLPKRADFETHSGGSSAGPDGEMTVAFGKQKGMKISELPDRDLAWYIEASKKSIADPEKAKWKDKEQKRLDSMLAEQEKRKAPATPPPLSAEHQELVDQFTIRFNEEAQTLPTLVKIGAEIATQPEPVRVALQPIYRARKSQLETTKTEPGSAG